jgi:tripartite-type tricarboxylate transporter receptor subunit TctC
MKTLMLAAALAACGAAARAETVEAYPSKPVQLIVPFAAGGGSDTLARAVGQKLAERWKQPVIVQNKPGADGNLGAQFVAGSPADGYTLMVLDIGTLTMGPVFYKNLPFDPATAFAPVTVLTFSPHVLVVNPAVPAKGFAELKDYAAKHPDALNFATHNNSAALAGYKLSNDTGLKMTQIPYKGAGAAMTGLLGGEVNVTLVSLLLASPYMTSGQLRPIAIASAHRMPTAPNVPTLIEAGVPGYVMGSWQGVVAPARTPPALVRKIQAAIAEVLKDKAVRERFEGLGAEVMGNTPDEMGELISSQSRNFLAIGKEARLQPQ